MCFGFDFFFSYEIALVIFAEGDIKLAIYVALSLSFDLTKKKKKKHFRAISNNIIDMAIRMFLYIKSTEENKQRKNRAVLVVMRIAL